MIGVLTRIFLRYASGLLVARGLLGADDASMLASDPDISMLIETGLGLAVAGATEVWWWITKLSAEAETVGAAVDKGQKITIEGPRGGETVVQKAAS
jgi:hypothetical protein